VVIDSGALGVHIQPFAALVAAEMTGAELSVEGEEEGERAGPGSIEEVLGDTQCQH
jgi:hypothetical protein